MRRGEVAQLSWRAVDLDAATVTVAKAKTVRGRRTIDLDSGTVAVLREYRARQRRGRLAAGRCGANTASCSPMRTAA
jgi:integrase